MLPLLKHLGWDPDSPMDSLDNSLLHVAAEMVRPDLVRQIMSGSSSTFIQNSEGDLPLHLLLRMDPKAWDSDAWAIAEMLLRRDTEDQLNSTDREGVTALHHIVRSIHRCSGREGQPDTDLVRYCIDHGADVTIKDGHGNIPLNMTLSSARSLDDSDVQRSLANSAKSHASAAFKQEL